MIELCNDLMQGKADPSKIAAFLTSTGTHFWKGAVVGAAVTFVLTNSAVKSALGDTFSAILGGAKAGGE
jgi:anthranilate phosphoribosyltransferase